MKPQSLLALMLIPLLAACAVGPDYRRPAVDVPGAFKEAPAGWKPAQPADTTARADWWKAFDDPVLDGLVAQLDANNQTLKSALANYRQARAEAQAARAAFFPLVTASASDSRAKPAGGPIFTAAASAKTTSLDASWTPDLWGSVRRAVESNDALAQSSAATLAATRLALRAELVTDYLQYYVLDRQVHLTGDSVAAFTRTLQITRNQLRVGIVTPVDVAQAQAQVKSAEAQQIDYALSKRQLEHAIAILTGKPPASFSLTAPATQPQVVGIPARLPSALLERRPDIAASERAVMSANAQIGVARAAYFPDLALSASSGSSADALAGLFTAPARTWALGTTLAETLFDAGLRGARVDAAVAARDSAVAQYRQTVLGGLQEVEDNLAAITLLADEAARQAEAVTAAQDAERLSINEYKAGTADFTVVATNQAARLQAEISAQQILGRRYSAAVALIEALGGGWDGNLRPDA